ncbi:hypothetical protein [Oerskovia merdavium]|uniref:HTTM domain-containing protein n=1 Tax=Oerskovia merdavium TaxID=2762227 RepID=A0ABR8TWA3_9CELL|nr:hypothetical protein [Oerskovia merdavium]MBD7980064.1 hypothetical protein [Oerskovia merdavium]
MSGAAGSSLRRTALAVDRALLAPGPAHRLLEVRTLLALVIGLRLATRDWTAIARRPAALTDHGNVMGWLALTPPAWLLVAVQVAGLTGVALVVAHRRGRAGFVLAWCTYTALTALWGSSGKVLHNDVLTVTVAVALLLAADPPRPARTALRGSAWGWPPRAALATLATVYFLTGAQKLRHSGPEWVFSDNMSWVLRQGAGGSPFGARWVQTIADQPVLTQALAGGALALELTAPLWLAIRVTRIPFVLAVAAMHGSIWVFLGLDYSAWVLTAAAVAVPLALRPDQRLLGGVLSPGRGTGRRLGTGAGGAGAPVPDGAPGDEERRTGVTVGQ